MELARRHGPVHIQPGPSSGRRARMRGVLAVVATASAFLAVGFALPHAQAHDELKTKFIVATKAVSPYLRHSSQALPFADFVSDPTCCL
jgi:hypothetical protein